MVMKALFGKSLRRCIAIKLIALNSALLMAKEVPYEVWQFPINEVRQCRLRGMIMLGCSLSTEEEEITYVGICTQKNRESSHIINIDFNGRERWRKTSELTKTSGFLFTDAAYIPGACELVALLIGPLKDAFYSIAFDCQGNEIWKLPISLEPTPRNSIFFAPPEFPPYQGDHYCCIVPSLESAASHVSKRIAICEHGVSDFTSVSGSRLFSVANKKISAFNSFGGFLWEDDTYNCISKVLIDSESERIFFFSEHDSRLGELVCLDYDGKKIWNLRLPNKLKNFVLDPINKKIVYQMPSLKNNEEDYFCCIDSEHGGFLWQHSKPLAKMNSEYKEEIYDRLGFLACDPIHHRTFISTKEGVCAFDSDGKELWLFRAASPRIAAVSSRYRRLYICSEGSTEDSRAVLYCIKY